MNDLKEQFKALTKEQRAALLNEIKNEEKQKPTPEFDKALTSLVSEFGKLDADQKKNLYKRHKDLLASIGLKAGTSKTRLDSLIKLAIQERGEAGFTAEEIKALPSLTAKHKAAAIEKTLTGGRCCKDIKKLSVQHWWMLKGKKYVPRPE